MYVLPGWNLTVSNNTPYRLTATVRVQEYRERGDIIVILEQDTGVVGVHVAEFQQPQK